MLRPATRTPTAPSTSARQSPAIFRRDRRSRVLISITPFSCSSRRPMTHLIRNRRGRRGNGAIEFAIGFSMLWACFAGVFQYGYSMFIYNGLQNAITDGAAYASRATICAANSNYATQVKQLVVYGDPAVSSGTTTVPGLAVGNVTVTPTPAVFPSTVTVQINNF